MKFLIIIPTHNEEENILLTLNSLKSQGFQDFTCVIVNDGSTDRTREMVEGFIDKKQFQLINLEKSAHSPGAKVVSTFYKGLSSQNLDDFDVICKFDADIIFPENYLEEINRIYEENPKAGMVSGLVYIKKDENWVFENISSKNHVRGPIKSYRKECFLQMGGIREVLGWDNIDVMLCQMHGYQVVTNKSLWVKHLRPTAYKYKNAKAKKLGEYFYNIGLDFPLAFISSAKSSFKNRSLSEFFITMKTFLSQKQDRKLSREEIKYIRNLRWREILKKF